jgi:hypothetical protein
MLKVENGSERIYFGFTFTSKQIPHLYEQMLKKIKSNGSQSNQLKLVQSIGRFYLAKGT